jgi:hypothetical protein
MAVAELTPAAEPETPVEAPEEDAPQEAPSVFSVVNRHIVGRVDVTPPIADGSRVVRLYSANAGTIIEANLSQELSTFLSGKLVEVEVIEEGAEDAGSGE